MAAPAMAAPVATPNGKAARWELEERRRCARCVVRWRVRAGGVLRSGEARAWEGTFARSASWSEALEAAGFLVAVGFFAAGMAEGFVRATDGTL